MKISVFIITKDEEANLPRALGSVQDLADEIIVVDSGSTDRTLEIARAHGAQTHHKDWKGYGAQKEFARSLCKGEWLLNLDADEELTPELAEEIRSFTANPSADALSIPFRENFMSSLTSRWTRLNRNVRLFKASKGNYPNRLVHETPTIKGSIAQATHPILHHCPGGIANKVSKNNQYSGAAAKAKFDGGRKSSLAKLLVITPFAFFKSYFLRRNCFNGKRGFIGSMINAFYAFLKEAKLYENEIDEGSAKMEDASNERPDVDTGR